MHYVKKPSLFVFCFILGLLLSFNPLPSFAIVQDAAYYYLEKFKKEQWAKDNQEVQEKLQALEKKIWQKAKYHFYSNR